MSDDTYTIRVNQFTDGPTGHVNITFIGPGTYVTYGSNLSPGMGVQIETTMTELRISSNPGGYSATSINVSADQFYAALNFSLTADQVHNSYFALCNNCVDFSNEVLRRAGQGEWSIANYLTDGTLTDLYAKLAERFCANPFIDVQANGGLLDFLSPQGLPVAQDFMDTLDLFQHPDWFAGFYDPDAVADQLLLQLKGWGKQLGLDEGDFGELDALVASGIASPLVIDLEGDGLQASHILAHSVQFDIDGDGHVDRTAWTSGGDGFLAVDRDGDGAISSVHELFGGLGRGDAFARLAEFDSDGDGALTAADADFARLLVWRDADADAVSDAGELVALADAGVSRIELGYRTVDEQLNGNLVGEVSSAVVDGSARLLADVYFRYVPGTADGTDAQPPAGDVASAVAPDVTVDLVGTRMDALLGSAWLA